MMTTTIFPEGETAMTTITQTSPDHSTVPPAERRVSFIGRRAIVFLVIAVGVAAAYVGISSNDADTRPGGSTSSADTKLEQAVEEVNPSILFTDISVDGKSLSFNTAGEEASGLPPEEAVGILIYLDAPDSLFARMDNTRALDGTQTATWDDITAYWTYHPDAGLSVVLEER